MDVIKKKTTPHSTHYIVQTRPGYYPSSISNKIVADFKRGLITHETILSASKRPHSTSNNKHSRSYARDNLSLDYQCNISLNSPKHEEDIKTNKAHNYTRHHHYPSVYSPLTQTNEKKVDYFNRTVVLPSSSKSSHFNCNIKSSKKMFIDLIFFMKLKVELFF